VGVSVRKVSGEAVEAVVGRDQRSRGNAAQLLEKYKNMAA
jgi:hypothetical protein